MIFGIGTDIVRVARMARDLDKFGDRFARHILTDHEMTEFRENPNRAHFLARRFAAKEAAAKAMGTGFSAGIKLRDICVGHNAAGKPLIEFSGRALEFIRDKKIEVVHVSLADEADHAVAFVTLETKDG